MDDLSFAEKIRSDIEKFDFIIVEGNMLSQMEKILELLDRVVFVTLEREICRKRREKRTDYEPADVPG